MRIMGASRLAFAALLLLAASSHASARDDDRCVTLNSNLSVCTDIPDVSVSFIDATETKVLGVARLKSRNDITYVFGVDWDVATSLDDFAFSLVQELDPKLVWQGPIPVTVRGLRATRYDGTPAPDGEAGSPAKSALFIDTGAGIASFIGSTTGPDVTPEELFTGAECAAGILRIEE